MRTGFLNLRKLVSEYLEGCLQDRGPLKDEWSSPMDCLHLRAQRSATLRAEGDP